MVLTEVLVLVESEVLDDEFGKEDDDDDDPDVGTFLDDPVLEEFGTSRISPSILKTLAPFGPICTVAPSPNLVTRGCTSSSLRKEFEVI